MQQTPKTAYIIEPDPTFASQIYGIKNVCGMEIIVEKTYIDKYKVAGRKNIYHSEDKVIAIVLAGGRGSRMKSSVPKQFMNINDRPVIYYSLTAFQESDLIDNIILVTGENDIEYCKNEIVDKYNFTKVTDIVAGGAERYNSVYNGLQAVKKINKKIKGVHESDITNDNIDKPQKYVMIHDGARACITDEVIQNCYTDVKNYNACVAAVPVKDTIKVADGNGFAINTPDRSTLWQVQTPQAFEFKLVYEAYNKMIKDDNRGNITDDAMVVEKYSDTKVKMSLSQYSNIKITTPDDIVVAKSYLEL